MATKTEFLRFEAIYNAFNPPLQVNRSKAVWMRRDSLVMASRFVLAFNCKDGPDPVQAASTLTMPENHLAKEVWHMTAYLFDMLTYSQLSYNTWVATEKSDSAHVDWDRYTQKPELTREDVASLAGPLGSQWLAYVSHSANDPLCTSRKTNEALFVSLDALCLPWHSEERRKVLDNHSDAHLIHYHDTYRGWGPLSDAAKQEKTAIVYEILQREKSEMRKVEKGYPREAILCERGPDELKVIWSLTRISCFGEIYRLRDRLVQSRLYMGIRVDQRRDRRWEEFGPRNWAYTAHLLRGHFDGVERNPRSITRAAADLTSTLTSLNKKLPAIPSQEPTTDLASKPVIAPEGDTALHFAISNRMWHVKHAIHVHGVREQDINKAACFNTELGRQAVRSIKLLHEKEGENGYGWDKPASAMILRAVVKNDDDWLFQ